MPRQRTTPRTFTRVEIKFYDRDTQTPDEPSLLELVDRARGNVSRSDFIRTCTAYVLGLSKLNVDFVILKEK